MGVFVIGITNAFFSDEETSVGNTFVAGALDLKIDNESYYNGELWEGTTWREYADLNDGQGPAQGAYLFFDFRDLKPDDEGEDTISLHVENDAYACMNIVKTADDDVTCTEPELIDDPTCNDNEPTVDLTGGELGGLLEFMFWADDGDNVLEEEEQVFKSGTAAALFDGAIWTLADSLTNIWDDTGPMLANTDYYIGKAWCFGDLTSNPVAGDGGVDPTVDPGVLCDGTALDNASQTDKFMADIEFSAVQARHNDDFLCIPDEITACVPGFATGFEQENQGLRKNGTAVLAERSDPNAALGAPQSTGTPSDTPVFGSFYSLGFGPENTPGGSLVLTFDDPIVDTLGHFDFRVFEVTGGTYPDEKILVEASQEGTTWHTVTASATRDAFLDLGVTPLAWASHLRITDVSDKSIFEDTADAYDLDGVETYCGTQPIPN